MASQLVGIAAASATGGDVQKGADIAKSATAYNYLNHHEVDDLVKDLKGCRSAADPKLCRTDIAAQYKTISDKTTNSKLGGCAGETGCFEQLEVVDGATKALDQYASDKDLGPEEKSIIQDFQESNFHDYVIARNIWLSGFLKEVTPIILSGGAGAVTKAEGTAGKTAAAETELGGGAKAIDDSASYAKWWDDLAQPKNLTDREARAWYLSKEAEIPARINSSAFLEEQAKQAFDMRNDLRSTARELMSNRTLADSLNKTDPNRTWSEIVDKYSGQGGLPPLP